MKKRIISLLTVLILVFTILPANASDAFSKIIAQGSCGVQVGWTLDGKGTLTISGTGPMRNYEHPDLQPWEKYEDKIHTVIIKEGVTAVGDRAFYGNVTLKKVSFPLSLKKIGECAFYGCENLKELYLKNVQELDVSAFGYCYSITKLTIPSCMQEVGKFAFSGCKSLRVVTIEEGVTSIGKNAFSRCTSLTDISIPESVTEIAVGAFSGCSSLQTIRIPAKVAHMGASAFSGCSSLTNIETDNNAFFSSEDGMLFDKNKETLICYPAGKKETSYSVPESVKTIGSYAFFGCNSLESVNLPKDITRIGLSAFSECEALEKIDLPENLTEIGSDAFAGCKTLTEIIIPDGVTDIEYALFRGCTSLEKIKLPENCINIGSAFNGCSALKTLEIPESVKKIGWRAFEDCSSLEGIKISSKDVSLGLWLFGGCDALTIFGHEGSTAEEYARSGGRPFVALETIPKNALWTDFLAAKNAKPCFVDIESHAWARDEINALADEGIIKGTSETTFSPAANITRADFTILLVRAFKLESENTENFSDVAETDYFARELAIARNTGIVNGIGDNKYAPRNPITRQDMMTIVYRALNSLPLEGKVAPQATDEVDVADFDTVADYAKEAVSALVTAGIVNGKNGLIAPTDYTTRAEVAVLIARILGK